MIIVLRLSWLLNIRRFFEVQMAKFEDVGWLSKAIVESMLILIGILTAFALEEWKDERNIQILIIHSINNFEHEIKQNSARINDVNIYHKGVQQVLQNRESRGTMNSIAEFRNILDAMQPIVLTNSAWDTAVATGVFTRMDFELVSALTLTYNTQARFDENYRTELRTMLSPSNLNNKNLEAIVYNASQLVSNIIAQESELAAYYDQVLAILRSHLSKKS